MSKRIVSWNIRHGGGDGQRSARIREILTSFAADLLVIPEFRSNPGGQLLKTHLAGFGYHVSHPDAEPKANTVLVASRTPVRSAGPLLGREELGRRLWQVDVDWINLCGVYMALGNEKLPYWEALVEAAGAPDAPDLFIGDFNTGNNTLDLTAGATPFVLSEYMERMADTGCSDVWRARHGKEQEYSWYSNHGGGFRLNHAFLRGGVDRVRACEFDHNPRESKASDHSVLLLELDVVPSAGAVSGSLKNVIYAFADPINPARVKIGKDKAWPQGYRQAQAHSPRGLGLVGVWPRPGTDHRH